MKYFFLLLFSFASCTLPATIQYERHDVWLKEIATKQRLVKGELKNFYECTWLVDDRYEFVSYEWDTTALDRHYKGFVKR